MKLPKATTITIATVVNSTAAAATSKEFILILLCLFNGYKCPM